MAWDIRRMLYDGLREAAETKGWKVVEQHWPAFRERAEQAGGLPKLVVREMEVIVRPAPSEGEGQR